MTKLDPDTDSLAGRRALVTGASKNLGSAIATALARRGARVAVNYRASLTEAEAVVVELESHGPGHLAVAGDVSQGDEVVEMVESVVAAMGGLDILVNNAGPYGATPLSQVDETEWQRVIDTNLKGTWLCVRAAAPYLRRSRAGRVVNLSAVSAQVRNRGAYGLAKAAVEVLTEQLALELAEHSTVNAVAPGQIDESLAELSSLDRDWARAVLDRTPSRRLVTRREVGEVVALLCTDTFASMTGTTLRLDGGLGLNRF